MKIESCPFCGQSGISSKGIPRRDACYYSCLVCGDFILSRQTLFALSSLTEKDKARISAFTRERQIWEIPAVIISNERNNQGEKEDKIVSIQDILAAFPRLPSERMDRALRNLHRKSEHLGDRFELIGMRDYPVLFAENEREFYFLRDALNDAGWINVTQANTAFTSAIATLTVQGWNRIAELERQKGDKGLKQVFIAMWFDPSMDSAYKNGIEEAVKASGYKPIRIDNKEHNDKVCDQIIAEIRKSKFLVADFTKYRSGVFFEAGFALGIGIPVIWTCRDDFKDELSKHFDTRQYNHILWKDEADLREKLRSRVEATILPQ